MGDLRFDTGNAILGTSVTVSGVAGADDARGHNRDREDVGGGAAALGSRVFAGSVTGDLPWAS